MRVAQVPLVLTGCGCGKPPSWAVNKYGAFFVFFSNLGAGKCCPVVTLHHMDPIPGHLSTMSQERERVRERERETQGKPPCRVVFVFLPATRTRQWMFYVATARCLGKRRGLSC